MFFDFSRSLPFPTAYPENKTPVTVDVLEVGWIVAFITVFTTFCIIAIARPTQGYVVFVRVTTSLFIGLVIMLCNFGHEWEVGHVRATTAYRAGIADHIEAEIGVKLGLRAVNITLKAPDRGQEKINYNERFWWTWTQGRNGFGPFAGELQQEFREHQRRGTPYPILWVAEYFVLDGEGIRFGRHYRHAGWYAHICVWTAFPLWLLTHVTMLMVPVYGGLLLMLTGVFLVIAAMIWSFNRNFIELAIPFSHGKENVLLETHFGVHWYLALCVGLGCMVLGGLISVLANSEKFVDLVMYFFEINPLDFVDISEEEAAPVVKAGNSIEMDVMNQDNEKPPAVNVALRYRGSKIWHHSRTGKNDNLDISTGRRPSISFKAEWKKKFQTKKLRNIPEAGSHQINEAYDPPYANIAAESSEAEYENLPKSRPPPLPPKKH